MAADYLADAASGRGRLVLVAGEAGVGKTTYVDAVVRAAGGVARFAQGGCDGSSTPSPLGPLREMLADLPDGVWPEGAERHDVFTRLSETLRAADPPYLLVIEDAHWADDATLDLLRHLARRIHRWHAMVLVTYRVEEVTGTHPLRIVLGDVASAPGLRRIDIGPLTANAVRGLVAAQPGSEVDPDELYRETGGNPFYVTEVLAAGDTAVPSTVRDAVLSRTARLSPEAREALDVVALAGPRAEMALVADGGTWQRGGARRGPRCGGAPGDRGRADVPARDRPAHGRGRGLDVAPDRPAPTDPRGSRVAAGRRPRQDGAPRGSGWAG